MPTDSQEPRLLARVDVLELDTIWWGPLRQLLPAFVEKIELARYLDRLLANQRCRPVKVLPTRDADGRASTHVFDVVLLATDQPVASSLSDQ